MCMVVFFNAAGAIIAIWHFPTTLLAWNHMLTTNPASWPSLDFIVLDCNDMPVAKQQRIDQCYDELLASSAEVLNPSDIDEDQLRRVIKAARARIASEDGPFEVTAQCGKPLADAVLLLALATFVDDSKKAKELLEGANGAVVELQLLLDARVQLTAYAIDKKAVFGQAAVDPVLSFLRAIGVNALCTHRAAGVHGDLITALHIEPDSILGRMLNVTDDDIVRETELRPHSTAAAALGHQVKHTTGNNLRISYWQLVQLVGSLLISARSSALKKVEEDAQAEQRANLFSVSPENVGGGGGVSAQPAEAGGSVGGGRPSKADVDVDQIEYHVFNAAVLVDKLKGAREADFTSAISFSKLPGGSFADDGPKICSGSKALAEFLKDSLLAANANTIFNCIINKVECRLDWSEFAGSSFDELLDEQPAVAVFLKKTLPLDQLDALRLADTSEDLVIAAKVALASLDAAGWRGLKLQSPKKLNTPVGSRAYLANFEAYCVLYDRLQRAGLDVRYCPDPLGVPSIQIRKDAADEDCLECLIRSCVARKNDSGSFQLRFGAMGVESSPIANNLRTDRARRLFPDLPYSHLSAFKRNSYNAVVNVPLELLENKEYTSFRNLAFCSSQDFVQQVMLKNTCGVGYWHMTVGAVQPAMLGATSVIALNCMQIDLSKSDQLQQLVELKFPSAVTPGFDVAEWAAENGVDIPNRRARVASTKRTAAEVQNSCCYNCGTTTTRQWCPNLPESGKVLCTDCGMYYKRTGTHRPERFWKNVVPLVIEAAGDGDDSEMKEAGGSGDAQLQVTRRYGTHVAARLTAVAVAGGGDGDPGGGGGSTLAGGITEKDGDVGDAKINTDAGNFIDSSANASKNAVQQSSSVLTSALALLKQAVRMEEAAIKTTAMTSSSALLNGGISSPLGFLGFTFSNCAVGHLKYALEMAHFLSYYAMRLDSELAKAVDVSMNQVRLIHNEYLQLHTAICVSRTHAVVKAVFGGEDIAALYATAVLESQQLLKDADAHFKTTISWRAAIIEAAAPNNAFNNAIDSSKVLSAKAFEYLQQAIQLVKLVAEEAVAGVVAFRVVPAYADLIATSQQLVRGVNDELGRMQQSLTEAGNRRGEG